MVERDIGIKEPVLEWLQNNVEKVISGDSSVCTILAYDFRDGGKKLMAPPLRLPTGEGPFSKDKRETVFRTVLGEVLGVNTEEELERYLEVIEVTIKEKEPDRIKEESHWDIMKWQFPTGHDGVWLIVERYQDSQVVLGEAWHLKNIKPKSIWEKATRRLRRSLQLDFQYWPTR